MFKPISNLPWHVRLWLWFQPTTTSPWRIGTGKRYGLKRWRGEWYVVWEETAKWAKVNK